VVRLGPSERPLDQRRGVISGTPTAAGSFSVTVQATDSAQVTATKALTITVTAALTITTATLPNGTVGTSYTATTLAAAGGLRRTVGPPQASERPFDEFSRRQSGTPTASGSFSVTVQVTDAAKASSPSRFSITVIGVLTITTATLPNGTVGQPTRLTTVAATGGTPPYTWSASGLPNGLSISAAGVISGTPTASGSSYVTVKVTDRAGHRHPDIHHHGHCRVDHQLRTTLPNAPWGPLHGYHPRRDRRSSAVQLVRIRPSERPFDEFRRRHIGDTELPPELLRHREGD